MPDNIKLAVILINGTLLVLGCIALAKCMKRRQVRERKKNEMRMIRQQYSTRHNMNLYEMSKFQTLHV